MPAEMTEDTDSRGMLLCTAVTDDGLRGDKTMPHCVNVLRCIEKQRCFWRLFHELPPDKFCAKT